jgi:hypothetical protein
MFSMESIVTIHTLRLIHQGVFNQFTDLQLSQVYINLLRPSSLKTDQQLLQFWYKGDFSAAQLTFQLINATNKILASYNQPIIEGYIQIA